MVLVLIMVLTETGVSTVDKGTQCTRFPQIEGLGRVRHMQPYTSLHRLFSGLETFEQLTVLPRTTLVPT